MNHFEEYSNIIYFIYQPITLQQYVFTSLLAFERYLTDILLLQTNEVQLLPLLLPTALYSGREFWRVARPS